MQLPSPAQIRAADADDGFFIPDLCAPQAVFLAVLLAELAVLLHVLALGPLRSFDWQAFALGSLFVQWNTLLCIGLICALRSRLRRVRPAVAGAVCLLLVGIVAVASSLLATVVYPLPGEVGRLPDLLLRNVLLALILAAILLRYSYLQQRVALQRRSELQLRLDALRARIRPHFLFNTLNSIASLIAIEPGRAERAVEDVAELFRAALKAEEREGSFAEERQICELYLDLETLRLGDRLRVRWEVDGDLDALPLPTLMLQPLVENAVYHGVAQRPDGGDIVIRARRDGDFLVIDVSNPLPAAPVRPAGSGQRMAQENIRLRVRAYFGERGSFRAGPEGSRYLARLRLPLPQEDRAA